MTRQVTIAYYEDSAQRGGTTRYLSYLIGGLDRLRFKPLLLACHARDWHDDLRGLGVEVITLDGVGRQTRADTRSDEAAHDLTRPPRTRPRLPQSIAWSLGLAQDTYQLARLFRGTKFDLLHSNHAGAEPAPIAARLAGVRRVIATWHVDADYDLFGERQGFRYRTLERASMHSLHHSISVSEATKQNWIARCGLNADYQSRISVIHNGIDLSQWQRRHSREAAKAALGLEPNTLVIGSIGRLDHAKGYRFLIDAFSEIVKRLPLAQLVIAGAGPLEGDLKALARTRGVEPSVLFTGFVRDVQTVLEAFDVYVQPSLCEAHGFGLLEAAGMGLPIVASRVGGNPETVMDGQSGYIVATKDATALVAPILRLLEDPSRRAQMGAAGRERVATHFTIRQMCEKTAAVYEHVLRRH